MSELIFRMSTREGYLFKTIAELFQASFAQIIFNINDKGIFCRMTNVQGTTLFDLELHKHNFNEFYLHEKELFFGVNISHLYKIISSIKKKDTIKLEIFADTRDKLQITIIPKDFDYKDMGFVMTEKVQNIDIDVPDGYEGFIQASYSKFSKMWKELLGVSKEVRIRGNSSRIEFGSIIDGILSKETEYSLEGALSLDVFDEVYQIEDLIKLNKLASFGSPIFFFIKEDLPLKLKTNVGSLGSLSVYICKD